MVKDDDIVNFNERLLATDVDVKVGIRFVEIVNRDILKSGNRIHHRFVHPRPLDRGVGKQYEDG